MESNYMDFGSGRLAHGCSETIIPPKYRFFAIRDWFSYLLLILLAFLCTVPIGLRYVGGLTLSHLKWAVRDIADPPKKWWETPEDKCVTAQQLPKADLKGITILRDERRFDLRRWKKVEPVEENTRVEPALFTRKLRLIKKE